MIHFRQISLFTIFLVPLAIGTGCTAARIPINSTGTTSYSVQISLHIDSLANDSWIYFQNGRQVDRLSLNRLSVYCRLHVYNENKNAAYRASVTPGLFTASGVRNRTEASATDSPLGYHFYQVKINITAAVQSDIQSLTCAKQSDSLGDYYPTPSEIDQALGALIEVTPLSISSNR